MTATNEPDPVVGQEFADALGGEVVGEITASGLWLCLTPCCGATGRAANRDQASLDFHRHRSQVHSGSTTEADR